MVALEDALQGNTTATAYAAEDAAQAVFANRGDNLQMFLKAGETAVIGSPLISAGDGTLVLESNVTSGVTVKDVVAYAEEALDLSASGTVATLVDVLVR